MKGYPECHAVSDITPLDEALRAMSDLNKKREALEQYRERAVERANVANEEVAQINAALAKLNALFEVRGVQ